MDPFAYTSSPSKVIFGSGTIGTVASEVAGMNCKRALVLSTLGQQAGAQSLARQLGPLAAGVFSGAVMHTPVEVTDQAAAMARSCQADCLIALGGGSTIGLAKAIAWRTDLPQIAIPTTYAGSEATAILGETSGGLKSTRRDPRILPEVIIYDVEQTLTLSPAVSITSGFNAIAHAAEGLYTQEANPITSIMAEEGIRALAGALPRIARDPADRSARSDALYGAWLCGVVLGSVGMALHHKLCHTLGGTFGLPHAETHTVILPHALAYNAAKAPEAMARIARALSTGDAPCGLYDLARELRAPYTLKDIGMPETGLDQAADIAAANPYWNPREIERTAIRRLLENAFHGHRPMASPT